MLAPKTYHTDKKAIRHQAAFTLKALIVLGIMALFARSALNNGLNMKFEEILNDCMTSNEHIVMHHSGNSRVAYEIECKVTVFRGIPVNFNGEE